MPALSLKENLTNISDTLLAGGKNAAALWAILTALRGPDDDDDDDLKDATTAVIRHHLLNGRRYGWWDSNCDSALHTERRIEAGSTSDLSHFIIHAKSAFAALGLLWDAVNPPPSKE